MDKIAQTDNATGKAVSFDKWSEILSEVRRKQSIEPVQLQYTPLEPSLNESLTELDKFLMGHSTQPEMLSTRQLVSLQPRYE
jgi:aspartate/tyrosine/aromatic aminotransferase